ncbi:daptide-type RiPP [Streptomyces chrestomyceticus]|uniref:daptide-type RiPP n=1 Tax=Streptomyces chrestomyceticus TaxID=68185 RepID=UPI0035A83CFD
MQQIQEADHTVESAPEFWVEPLEELDAPGFMDGFAAGFGIVAGGVALAAT